MVDEEEMGFTEGVAGGTRLFEGVLVARKIGVDRGLLGGLSALVQRFPCGFGIPCFDANNLGCPVPIVVCRAHAVVGFAEVGVRRAVPLDLLDGFGRGLVAAYRCFEAIESFAEV
jgi:hypothetical protein